MEPWKRLTASQALEHHWIKQAQHKKVNLQKSISSNWTESCLSLKSAASKTSKKSRKPDPNTEHVKRNTKGTEGTTSHTTDCSWESKACGRSKRCLQSNHQRRDYKTVNSNVMGRHIPNHVVRIRETIDNAEDAMSFTSSNLSSRKKHCEGTGKKTLLRKQSETLRSEVVELPPLKTPFTPTSTWNEASMFRG